MEIPYKYIMDRGIRETEQWFGQIVRDQRLSHRVPIHYMDHSDCFIFVECDEIGNPMKTWYEFISFTGRMPKIVSVDEPINYLDTISYQKKVIAIDRPQVYLQIDNGMDFWGKVYKFLWEGKLEDKQELTLEQMDVKFLIKLTQEAIKKRQPIILDEVIKNKLIK